MSRRVLIAAATLVAVLAVPTSAGAATMTLTAEGAAPVPINPGTTVRDPRPQLGITFTAAEVRYSLDVLGPGGESALVSKLECFSTRSAVNERLYYHGNGEYKVILRTYPQEDRCATGETKTEQTFTIAAGSAVAAPAPVLLMRQPGTFTTITYEFAVDMALGADNHEVKYATGATFDPANGLSLPGRTAFPDPATGKARLYFDTPGTYLVTSRAIGYRSGATPVGSPWSQPIQVQVLAPFDFVSVTLPDSRGPSYRLQGQIREKSATGKVRISIARGKRGKFRSYGTVTIRRGGVFAKRFSIRRQGSYRIRYTFAGSPTVAPGRVDGTFRVRRRFFTVPN